MSEQHFSLLFLKMNIEKKKREMICIGLSKGLHHEETLIISQELDEYIIQYQTVCKKVEESINKSLLTSCVS